MIWWIAGVAAVLLVAALVAAAVDRQFVPHLLSRLWRGPRRLLRGLPLLPAVCLAVTGGVGIVLLATWILSGLLHPTAKAADPIDITKLSFTVAGGVGAAVALVVAYRRQRDVEQGRFVERFGAAAAQLGDHDVAVRIAGVYAMAGVADESTGLRRQQSIDVLCGYLRLPYSPEHGSNHRTKLVLTEPRTGSDGSSLGSQEEHLEYRQNDKEVRATIVRVMADHLRHPEYSWSAYNFDFRTAHLEDVEFGDVVFGGAARFDRAMFSGYARFLDARFSSDAWFEKANFSSLAMFIGATFSGDARFNRATFCADVAFDGARFSRDTWFNFATFSRNAGFGNARFSRDAWFSKATFSDDVGFDGATFSGDAWFIGSTFSGDTSFDEATFSGRAVFGDAAISGAAKFRKTTFSGPTSFEGTDFGNEAIVFENPQQWGPPAPKFDWDGDPSAKPENVTTQSWPPTAIPD